MKTAMLIGCLLASMLLHPYTIAAQSSTEPSVCEYQETRGEKTPINPKTNKPYTPDERNQEPFAGASISKDEIRQCLQAKTPIKNHHIVFENYRDAWQALAMETGDYAIPLLITGGVLHANTPYDDAGTFWNRKDDKGGIRLGEFRDPTVKTASDITEEQQKRFGIEKKDESIAFIHSRIEWKGVFIDSAISVFIVENEDTHPHDDVSTFIFSNITDFSRTSFSGEITNFSRVYFSGEITNFSETTFKGNETYFIETSFKGKVTYFILSSFKGNETYFTKYSFEGIRTYFTKSSFEGIRTYFVGAFFEGKETDFSFSLFKSNADFRDILVSERLTFDNTTWEKRIDFRGMSTKNLNWDSTDNPSNVKGILDMRDAHIGSALLKEVRFQDLVDFSRTTFGQYKIIDEDKKVKVERHPSPQIVLENDTFENEVDFLHVKFNAPTVFINNRFRSTLDLTGAKFEAQNSQDQNSHLCLSFNRINRLVFEPEHLGNPPGIFPYQQFMSLFTNPLHTSRVRRVDAPECMLSAETAGNPATITQDEEPLDDIYKTLGKSFREANDRAGINEAWYLETLAKREQDSTIWAWLSWFFLDIPSRYAVDVWRAVWISVFIMVGFYLLYLIEHIIFGGIGRLWRWIRSKPRQEPREVNILGHPDRHRAFRLRIFEPIHRRIAGESQRKYVPWRDAAALSVRSFLKIGLGTVYPNTGLLKFLTTVEWLIGAYMLIHFILAVKNNLPFILPFLGTVN